MVEVHPDKPGNGDGELARAVDEARTVLLDPIARARYDASRSGNDLVDEATVVERGERVFPAERPLEADLARPGTRAADGTDLQDVLGDVLVAPGFEVEEEADEIHKK